MTGKIITLVTGANRGIGYQIIKSMGAYFNNAAHSSGNSFTYLVGGRNQETLSTAVSQLRTELAAEGVNNPDVQSLELDITDDESIGSAVDDVQKRFGGLDVLVNNAGIARMQRTELKESRTAYNETLNTNVVSVANTIAAFAPLLQIRSRGLVVNVSSARGSIERLLDPSSAKTISVPYSMSKVALNGLTLELSKMYEEIEFQLVNPGFCKTDFNGNRGVRDPREGATVVTLLVERWLEAKSECGFWETVEAEWKLSKIPW